MADRPAERIVPVPTLSGPIASNWASRLQADPTVVCRLFTSFEAQRVTIRYPKDATSR